jgi:membrane protein DedA with SNARE-associated domain
VLDFDLLWPFLTAFVVFVSAGFGAPFPEELAIVGAGLWTATAYEKYGPYRWLMLPVCLVGVIIADVLLYGIGRRFGTRLLQVRWMARLVPAEKRARIEDNFQQYGVSILLFGRLLPGIRAPLFLTSGMLRVSFTRFLLADGIGAVLGNSLLFFLAFWFGAQFKELVERVEKDLNTVKPILILSLIVAVGIYFLVHFLRRPMPEGNPKELPVLGPQIAARIDHSDSVVKKPDEPVKRRAAAE